MTLQRIDHVGLAVEDLDDAIAYYADHFGAEVAHREHIDSDGVEEALIKVGESYIQLLAPTRDDSPVARFLERYVASDGRVVRLRQGDNAKDTRNDQDPQPRIEANAARCEGRALITGAAQESRCRQ
jgi:catechol 2,3-dioxygenase-like lactoylglutathione lyase family enzyme